VNGTINVFNACQKLEIEKLVAASSDCAYGFFEGTPDYLKETAPIRSTPGFPYSENKAKIENLVSEFAKQSTSCSVAVLRPCMVMGPNADNTTAKSMKQAIIIGIRSYDPIMQFVNEDDTAEAFYLAATKKLVAPSTLPPMKDCATRNWPKNWVNYFVPIPVWIIYPLVEMLYRLRLLPFGKAQLDYIRYPLSMDVSKIRTDLGFKPRYSTKQTLQTFLKAQ
jgi:UDP-glucose 4-epimerase